MTHLTQAGAEGATDRMAWFREARFGLFIHWGLYSLLKKGEWIFHMEGIPTAEYEALAEQFHPEHFDPAAWARLARQAGMGYVVFTTKHHDGFCLWDSQLTDYTSAQHGARRDYVREVVEAFRAEGLRIGLYYSLGDWHYPPYLSTAQGDRAAAPALRSYLHGHVRELLSNYGQIDMLWYDGAWFDGDYFTAETLGAKELDTLARELQPGILINPRAGVDGDFETCENELKPSPAGVDWEMCTYINDIRGYCEHDYNYKTVNQLIFTLTNCATQGGNLLLNIGPRGDGSIPAPQVERLQAVGAWMARHRESICGTERLPDPFFAFGRVTRKGARLYLHTFYWPGERMALVLDETTLGAPLGAAVRASLLTTSQPLCCHWEGRRLIVEGLPATPPDEANTVVVLEVG